MKLSEQVCEKFLHQVVLLVLVLVVVSGFVQVLPGVCCASQEGFPGGVVKSALECDVLAALDGSAGAKGRVRFPMRWSHCLCGPLLVRIQVYAERGALFHIGRQPQPKPGCERYSLRMAFPCALRPSWVAVLLCPAIRPK